MFYIVLHLSAIAKQANCIHETGICECLNWEAGLQFVHWKLAVLVVSLDIHWSCRIETSSTYIHQICSWLSIAYDLEKSLGDHPSSPTSRNPSFVVVPPPAQRGQPFLSVLQKGNAQTFHPCGFLKGLEFLEATCGFLCCTNLCSFFFYKS